MIGFDLDRFEDKPALRVNRAAEFFGMATISQLELLTRTLFPAFRDEFEGLALDEALLFRVEEATAVSALEPEIFCRPSDAILGFVSRIGAAVPTGDVRCEIIIVPVHGWPYPVVRPVEDKSA